MTKSDARRLVRAVDRSVMRLPLGYPRRSIEGFERLISQPVFDDYWDECDQEALEEKASGDQEFTARLYTDTNTVSVWKTVYRFTGRLVTYIIGPDTHMEFKSSSAVAKLARWSPAFIKYFHVLVVRPWFDFDTTKMALAMQWAVICRTDDRRVYPFSECDDDMFLLELVSVIEQEQDGSKSAPELREMACSRHMEKFPHLAEPPRWSRFLEFIEIRAYQEGGNGKKGKKGKEPATADTDIWGVGVPDLKAVLAALDRIRHGRMRMFTDAETIAEMFKLTRDAYDPPDQELSSKAIKGVYLQFMRNEIRSDRGGPLEVAPNRQKELLSSSPREDGERVDESVSDEEGYWAQESSVDSDAGADLGGEVEVESEDEDEADGDHESEHESEVESDFERIAYSWRSRKRRVEDSPARPQTAQKRPRGRPRKNPVESS